jgi:hypothetical protein
MSKTQDTTKSNTYRIENAFWRSDVAMTLTGDQTVATIADAQEIVDTIVAEYGMEAITVEAINSGNCSYWQKHTRTIAILPSMMKRWVIVHECAHALTDHRIAELMTDLGAEGEAGVYGTIGQTAYEAIAVHGSAFLNSYIDITNFIFGEAVAAEFTQTWKANKRAITTVAAEIVTNLSKMDKALVAKIRNWFIKLPESLKSDVYSRTVYFSPARPSYSPFRDEGNHDTGISIVREWNHDGSMSEPKNIDSIMFSQNYMTVTDWSAKGNVITFTLVASDGTPYADSISNVDATWYGESDTAKYEAEATKVHVTIDLDKMQHVNFCSSGFNGERSQYANTIAQMTGYETLANAK